MFKEIEGGVTAPRGFKASGVACGLKKDGKKDLALIVSDNTASAAGVFTTNLVKGHSLMLTMENIKKGRARAVLINSGNANACLGKRGQDDALEMATLAAKALGCDRTEVLVGSTGVIGIPLNMEAVRQGIDLAAASLSYTGGHQAKEAIMTTDLVPKEAAVSVPIGGKEVRIGGMAKGSGMIHPNMATMIGVITTDASISPELLSCALKRAVKHSFNRVSVDGDTSVCDMVVILANGQADNDPLAPESGSFEAFCEALDYVCARLAKMIAADGEGATKLVEVAVEHAPSEEDAYKIVCAVAKSPLVKTAIFGGDANWGRIFTAAGYSGARFNPDLADIYIGDLMVCQNGTALPFDEEKAAKLLGEKEVKILIDLKQGGFSDRMWTCDFSCDYVRINGSYRS